jgi:putative hemolysin
MLRPEPIVRSCAGTLKEIEKLDRGGKRLVENECYAVYCETGDRIPVLLSEIGRLRELTFRAVQEGTGKRTDLDEFDASYTHLVLWHKASASVAGSYRLAWTTQIAESERGRGLYTSTLFAYSPEFFSRTGPAVEVGRSFIARQHQREYAPLFLLWQAIARCVASRPDSPVLFGAVSISAAYSQAARELIVHFLRAHRFRDDLSSFVSPRHAFHPHLFQGDELHSLVEVLQEVDELPIQDLGCHEGAPVLLRQYLRLGGRVAGFNVDPRFSNVVDALLVVDLRLAPAKLMLRYMGRDLYNRFLERTRQATRVPCTSGV